MNRKEKIRLLEAIKSGLLKNEDLITEPCYIFFKENENCYRMNDIKYNKIEYETLLETTRIKGNCRRLFGVPDINVITIVYERSEGLLS